MEKRSFIPEAEKPEKKREIGFSLVSAEHTIKSGKRSKNEDARWVNEKMGLLALADGMGGSLAGEFASHKAIEILSDLSEILANSLDFNVEINGRWQKIKPFTKALEKDLNAAERNLELIFLYVANRVRQAVISEAAEKGFNSEEFSATTLVLVKICSTPNGSVAIVKSVGDSRSYIFKADGRVKRVPVAEDSALENFFSLDAVTDFKSQFLEYSMTGGKDFKVPESFLKLIQAADSKESFLVDLKKLVPVSDKYLSELFSLDLWSFPDRLNVMLDSELPKDRARILALKIVFLFRHYFYKGLRNKVTQMVGDRDKLDIHTAEIDLEPGDKLLVFSDGLSDNLIEKKMAEVLATADSFSTGVKELCEEAFEYSQDQDNLRAKRDDITAVGFCLEKKETEKNKEQIKT